MEKNTSHMDEAQKLHTPSIQASSFGLQLSRCQKATGALNSRNTSATVKLKPRGPVFLTAQIGHSNSGGVDLVDFKFQPILKICMYLQHKKGPGFLKREMNHPNPAADFFFKAICWYVRFQGG